MPTNTYDALRTTVLSSSQSSVTLDVTGITGYTDLVIVASLRADTVGFNNMNFPSVTFNGDSSSGLYATVNLYERNSSAASVASGAQNSFNYGGIVTTNMTSGIFSPYIIQLQNYSSSSVFKTTFARLGGASNVNNDGLNATVGTWKNTSPITTITFTAQSSGNFVSGSTFTVYGIASVANATGTAKATGGTITYDSFGNVFHTFTSSGTFTPSANISVDYLVVAGGGGGAGGFATGAGGGGGGAGGFRYGLGLSCASGTGLTVTIGAGGNGDTNPQAGAFGSDGNNSVFGSITSTGGGGGGGYNLDGRAGGSGGGGGNTQKRGGAGNSGNLNPSQGFAGGSGNAYTASTNSGTGGGGGAGNFGGNPNNASGSGASGGGGLVWIGNGSYYAGGGGGAGGTSGGSGGVGGGGAGKSPGGGTGTAGTANTGGGGGGAYVTSGGQQYGGAGGSGIVIIKYSGV